MNENVKFVESLGDKVEMSGGVILSISMLGEYIQEQVPPQNMIPDYDYEIDETYY